LISVSSSSSPIKNLGVNNLGVRLDRLRAPFLELLDSLDEGITILPLEADLDVFRSLVHVSIILLGLVCKDSVGDCEL